MQIDDVKPIKLKHFLKIHGIKQVDIYRGFRINPAQLSLIVNGFVLCPQSKKQPLKDQIASLKGVNKADVEMIRELND